MPSLTAPAMCTACAAGALMACAHAQPPSSDTPVAQAARGLELSLGVLLDGAKTTFRFEVANRCREVVAIDAPFANSTRLLVTSPDGKTQEHGRWKENLPPVTLKPGAVRAWDLDVRSEVPFARPGKYLLWFRAGKAESNRVVVVKDLGPGPMEPAPRSGKMGAVAPPGGRQPRALSFPADTSPVQTNNEFSRNNPHYKQRAGSYYEATYLGPAVKALTGATALDDSQRPAAFEALRAFIYDYLSVYVRSGGTMTTQAHGQVLGELDGRFRGLLTEAQYRRYLAWRRGTGAENPLAFLLTAGSERLPPDP